MDTDPNMFSIRIWIKELSSLSDPFKLRADSLFFEDFMLKIRLQPFYSLTNGHIWIRILIAYGPGFKMAARSGFRFFSRSGDGFGSTGKNVLFFVQCFNFLHTPFYTILLFYKKFKGSLVGVIFALFSLLGVADPGSIFSGAGAV